MTTAWQNSASPRTPVPRSTLALASARNRQAPVPARVESQATAAIAHHGQPLDAATRRTMESRFGHDFGSVRVHTEAPAAAAARAASARAYTVDQHIAFGHDQYAPHTARGTALLAHELAHTVQQGSSAGSAPASGAGSDAERSAETAARDVAAGHVVKERLPACQVGLARNVVPLDAYSDNDLANEIASLTERVKDRDVTDREWYRERLRQATAIAAARKHALEPAPPAAPASPPPPITKAPPPRDEAAERAQAVKEAEAVLAGSSNNEERDEEAAPVVSLHLGKGRGGGRSPKKTPSLPTTLSLVQPDPRWAEGERIEEEMKDRIKADHDRIDTQIDHDRKISLKPYADRMRQVRQELQERSNYWYSYNEAVSHMSGDEVWKTGLAMDLFLESEKKAVYEDQGELKKQIDEEVREKNRRLRAKFESDQYRALVARGEQLSSPAMFVQPVAFAALGPLVGAAYAGTQTGGMVGQAYNACVHGDTGDCIEAAAPLVVAAVLHRATRVPGSVAEGEKGVIAAEEPAAPAPVPERQVAGFGREIEPKPPAAIPPERQVAGFGRPLEPNPNPGPEPTIGFLRKPRVGTTEQVAPPSGGETIDMPPAREVHSSTGETGSQTGQVRTTMGGDNGEPIRATGSKGPGDVTKSAEPMEKPASTPAVKEQDPAPAPAPATDKPAAAPRRLITHEELNEPVPQRQGITGPKRRLTAVERKTANQVIDALEEVNGGKPGAMNRVSALRPHQHTTGDMAGWWSVDLVPGNPGALNVMRLYFRKGGGGLLEAVVRQGH